MKKRKGSLRFKISAIAIILLALMSFVVLLFNYVFTEKLIRSTYEQKIGELTKTVALAIDEDQLQMIIKNLTDKNKAKVKDYKESLKNNKIYKEQREMLMQVKKANDVKFLYIQKYEKDKSIAIMDTDTSSNAMIPGDSYHLDVGEKNIDLRKGTKAFMTKTSKYGWLMSISSPIFNNKNEVIAMIGADISMQDVINKLYNFLKQMFVLIFALMIFSILILYLLLNKVVVQPIALISKAANKFVKDRSISMNSENEQTEISKLNFRSRDEIGQLTKDIQKMEEDINNYITNLTQVTKDKERMGTELNVATQIQSDMLPKIFPFEPNRGEFDLHALMRPAKEVGGDFYDFFMLDDDHIAIVIGDVSDKGVPAALFMVISKTLIKDYTQARLSVDKVFNRVNNELCEGNEASLFTTSILGVFDVKTGRLFYADAGHEPLIIMDRNDKAVRYVEPEKRNFVLGGMEGTRYVINELFLKPGEILLLYTDGVPDAVNKENESFGWDRLKETCQKHMHEEVGVMLRNILADIDSYAQGVAQFDDITMLALLMITKGSEQALIEKLDLAVDEQMTDKALNFIEKAMDRKVIDTKTQHAFMVAVDELVSNVLNHSKASTLTFIIEIEKEKMSLTFIDDSFEFNPIEAKGNEDDDSDIFDKPIGGLGIYMVKKMMDNLEYEYKDGKNILKLVKKLK
ncbi:MAG: SpoIIE family protein phosphatase [Streptococcaceae bacterium]|jgi:sigma-B regulation protein RsbU (phosphoserine phosphatase)|nr:SpoIIE family protein phosphatase [Streptococcaceae bacterium]